MAVVSDGKANTVILKLNLSGKHYEQLLKELHGAACMLVFFKRWWVNRAQLSSALCLFTRFDMTFIGLVFLFIGAFSSISLLSCPFIRLRMFITMLTGGRRGRADETQHAKTSHSVVYQGPAIQSESLSVVTDPPPVSLVSSLSLSLSTGYVHKSANC